MCRWVYSPFPKRHYRIYCVLLCNNIRYTTPCWTHRNVPWIFSLQMISKVTQLAAHQECPNAPSSRVGKKNSVQIRYKFSKFRHVLMRCLYNKPNISRRQKTHSRQGELSLLRMTTLNKIAFLILCSSIAAVTKIRFPLWLSGRICELQIRLKTHGEGIRTVVGLAGRGSIYYSLEKHYFQRQYFVVCCLISDVGNIFNLNSMHIYLFSF